MSVLAKIGAVLLGCLMLAGLGAHWQSGRDGKALAAAQADAARYRDAAHALQSALDTVAQHAAARLQQLHAQQQDAARALADRDAQLQRIQAQAQQRQGALQQAIHENDDCKVMGTLPVCPAVAHRLWGGVSGRDTTAGY